MKKLLTVAVLVIALGGAVTTANAASLRVSHNKPFAKMTHSQKVSFLKRQIHKDHSVIRFWKNHTDLANIHRWIAHKDTHWAQTSLKIATANLHKLTYTVTVSYGFATPSGFPPHHALWLCEYRHEASTAPGGWYNRDTGHNSHYGGLQMHYNWGYGIVGYAYNYSQLEQEWAAERGYKANHYSHTWLLGQWAHYDCLVYA